MVIRDVLPHNGSLDQMNGTPIEVARWFRKHWEVRGPLGSLISRVESLGVYVVMADFGIDAFDGIAYAGTDDVPPVMFLNNQVPGDRLRWSVGHELGHLLMHRIASDSVEQEANEFASELLMPETDIQPQLEGIGRRSFAGALGRLCELKQEWQTSIQALLFRARTLQCITPDHYKYFMIELSRQGFRKVEPVEIRRETPRFFPDEICLADGPVRVAEQMGIDPDFFLDLSGLDRDVEYSGGQSEAYCQRGERGLV